MHGAEAEQQPARSSVDWVRERKHQRVKVLWASESLQISLLRRPPKRQQIALRRSTILSMGEGSRGAMREERRVVTALSADIVASTALGERLDPEDYRAIIGGAVAQMIAAVEELGGTIEALAGDGLLALFGAPVAHEDDPERAVRAGRRIVQRINSYSGELAGKRVLEGLDVRVGIETGLVVLGPVGAGQRVDHMNWFAEQVGDLVQKASDSQY